MYLWALTYFQKQLSPEMSQFHAVWMIVNVREVTAGALCLEAASHDRSCSSLSHPGSNGADSRLLQILIRSPAPGEVDI